MKATIAYHSLKSIEDTVGADESITLCLPVYSRGRSNGHI